jgi:hypothetical protein
VIVQQPRKLGNRATTDDDPDGGVGVISASALGVAGVDATAAFWAAGADGRTQAVQTTASATRFADRVECDLIVQPSVLGVGPAGHIH